MHTTPFSHIVATDEAVVRNDKSMGRSYLLMRGGYFYGSAQSEKHVPTPQGEAVMSGDNGTRGPFRKASEARVDAERRVSNAVFNGAADKAWMTAVKKYGPDSERARQYVPAPLSEKDISLYAAAVDAPRKRNVSVSSIATDKGVDPLTSFRALAANGSVARDDIRQLAAAYTHPDEDQRLAMPKTVRRAPEAYLSREDSVKLAAIRQIERSGIKSRAAEAYEEFGMAIAKRNGAASAMPFLMTSCSLAREHTRERGRDIRPMRKVAESEVR